jgi:hypothetical protein
MRILTTWMFLDAEQITAEPFWREHIRETTV